VIETTAIEEASHCIAADALGLLPFYATIKADEDSYGKVRWSTSADRVGWREVVIALLAGPVAAARHSGKGFLLIGDYAHVIEFAGRDAWQVPALRVEAEALVSREWPAITCLAKRLLRETSLGGRRLAAAIADARAVAVTNPAPVQVRFLPVAFTHGLAAKMRREIDNFGRN